MKTYQIQPRHDLAGGGYNAKVFEDGVEVAGAAFPLSDLDPTDEAAYIAAQEWVYIQGAEAQT